MFHCLCYLSPRTGILQSPLSVRLVTLSPLKPLDEIQPNLCVSCSHEWGAQRHIFFGPAPWGPGEGSKGQISLDFNYKVNFKIFKTDFVCLLTNERYKTYQTGFSFGRLGHAPGVGVLWGVGGQNFFFF